MYLREYLGATVKQNCDSGYPQRRVQTDNEAARAYKQVSAAAGRTEGGAGKTEEEEIRVGVWF